MSGPGVGFEYPPNPVAWLKRDALLFANSIGCKSDELHFLYELHPNFAVFPTYPVILRKCLSVWCACVPSETSADGSL